MRPTAAQRRVLEAVAGGCFIAYADGGPRVTGGGYRKGAYWLIGHIERGHYEATRISDRVMIQLQSQAWLYDYGDYGITPAGRAAVAAPATRDLRRP